MSEYEMFVHTNVHLPFACILCFNNFQVSVSTYEMQSAQLTSSVVGFDFTTVILLLLA